MSEQGEARLHAIIHGRVQGVSFRYFVREAASRPGVTGWVRNRFNRTVEVVAEGRRSVLENFLTALQRGPSASRVDNLDATWGEPTGEFQGFKVRMTR